MKTLAFILWRIVNCFRQFGRCATCGSFGALWEGACATCVGTVVESYRNDRKELLK